MVEEGKSFPEREKRQRPRTVNKKKKNNKKSGKTGIKGTGGARRQVGWGKGGNFLFARVVGEEEGRI